MNLRELVDVLRKKEATVNDLISELDDIAENDPIMFEKLVSLRKDKNKESKLNALKAKQKYRKSFYGFFIGEFCSKYFLIF